MFEISGYTYVESGLGSTKVWAPDVELTSCLPLRLGLFDLTSQAEVGLPAILVVGDASDIVSHLVVGKLPALGAGVSMADLQLGDSLLSD